MGMTTFGEGEGLHVVIVVEACRLDGYDNSPIVVAIAMTML